MKFILMFMMVLTLNLSADYVKKTMAVCADEDTMLELLVILDKKEVDTDALEQEMWLMSHNCQIIDKKTAIEVLDYTGKKTGIIKIKLKKKGEIVYGTGKAVQIEQPGDKNIILKF